MCIENHRFLYTKRFAYNVLKDFATLGWFLNGNERLFIGSNTIERYSMKAFKRRFASKEVKDALDFLNELGSEFDCLAFRILQSKLEDDFLASNKEVVALVKEGVSPRVQVYNAIANLAGDLVESGEYHVYRGVLNQEGQDLLRLFDTAIDRLAQNGAIDSNYADTQKAGIRKSIKSVG